MNQELIEVEIPISTHNDIHMEFNFQQLVQNQYDLDSEINVPDENDQEDDQEPDQDDDDIEAGLNEGENNGEIDADILEADDIPIDNRDQHAIVKLLGIQFDRNMTDSEKEKLVLQELGKRKAENNRRIGKYDVDDPFIDDEEEDVRGGWGWFVWRGSLDGIKEDKEQQVSEIEVDDEKEDRGARLKRRIRDVPVEDKNVDKRRKVDDEMDGFIVDDENNNCAPVAAKTADIAKLTNSETSVGKIDDLIVEDKAPGPTMENIANGDNSETVVRALKIQKELQYVEKDTIEKIETGMEPETETDTNAANEKSATSVQPVEAAIVESGPVIASSETNNSKVIIGSFFGFN